MKDFQEKITNSPYFNCFLEGGNELIAEFQIPVGSDFCSKIEIRGIIPVDVTVKQMITMPHHPFWGQLYIATIDLFNNIAPKAVERFQD